MLAQSSVNQADTELALAFPGCGNENEFWTTDYTPVWDEVSQAVGVLVICQVSTPPVDWFQANLNRVPPAIESPRRAIGQWISLPGIFRWMIG